MKAYYSYVMGVDNSIYDLEKQGFLIENDGNNFMITFNADNASKWENFICKHLELGYWNEYLTENGVIFLFHLEDGIKKYEVYHYENAEVLALCEKLCECKFESIRSMLSGNHFYREKIKQKKMYLDMTEAGCTGVWIFAKEYDIQFVFEDKVPVIDFYASKEAAMQENAFLKPEEMKGEQNG